jgi:hypothetical protein
MEAQLSRNSIPALIVEDISAGHSGGEVLVRIILLAATGVLIAFGGCAGRDVAPIATVQSHDQTSSAEIEVQA